MGSWQHYNTGVSSDFKEQRMVIETLKWICCKTYGRSLRTMYKVPHFGVNLN